MALYITQLKGTLIIEIRNIQRAQTQRKVERPKILPFNLVMFGLEGSFSNLKASLHPQPSRQRPQ